MLVQHIPAEFQTMNARPWSWRFLIHERHVIVRHEPGKSNDFHRRCGNIGEGTDDRRAHIKVDRQLPHGRSGGLDIPISEDLLDLILASTVANPHQAPLTETWHNCTCTCT